MNERSAARLPSDAARWLEEGSDHAPAALLGRVLDHTGATRQRPGRVAAVLGAPTMGTSWRSVSPLRAATVAAILLAGVTVVVLLAGALRQDRLVLVATPAPSVSTSPQASPVESAEIALAPDFDTGLGATIVQDADDPWTLVQHKPSDNPRRQLADNQLEVFYGDCLECASTLRVDLTFGTRDQGVVVGWIPCRPETPAGLPCFIEEAETGGIPQFVQGDTTEALTSAWMARHGQAPASTHVARQVEWTILHYPGLVVALVVRLDQAVVMSIGPNPDVTTGRRETLAPHFLDLVMFAQELPPSTAGPRTATTGDLELAIPAGWILAGGGPRITLTDGRDFLFVIQTIDVLAPGDKLLVARSSDDTEPFSVAGATFAELVLSIDRGIGPAGRRPVTIGGTPGYRWTAQQQAIVGPLAMMAALEWKGRFYVFLVRFPVDGAPGDLLGPVLDGVTLR
jgi:hypothetical protein